MGSKRLKKILKSKEFKLSLLCATTFAFLLASGQSFAKYYEEQKNNAAACIATIGSVDFSYNVSRTEVLGDLEIGLYAFIAHFHVTYGASEVARTSSVDLRLSTMDNNNFLSTNSAHYPVHTAFGIKDGTESTHTKNDVYPNQLHTLVNKEITNENGSKEVISEFTPNINLNTLVGNTTEETKDEELNTLYYDRVYFAHSHDGTNYDWDNKELDSLYTFQIVNNEEIGMTSTTHYFKVIFFIFLDRYEYNGEYNYYSENSQILFHLTLSQIGGED